MKAAATTGRVLAASAVAVGTGVILLPVMLLLGHDTAEAVMDRVQRKWWSE